MLFGFYSKKELDKAVEQAVASAKKELDELAKKEYLRGAAAAAEAFKDQEAELASSKARLLDDWATIKRAKEELENNKATLILNGIKDIFRPATVEYTPVWRD